MEDVRPNVYFMFNSMNYVQFQRLAGASLLVFANKEDLPGSMTDEEIRDVWLSFLLPLPSIYITPFFTQALDLPSITTHHWKIWRCSAITGRNLVHGLDWVVHDIAGRLYYNSVVEENQMTAQ
jgi:ADP-ribosylation factor-like protein 2